MMPSTTLADKMSSGIVHHMQGQQSKDAKENLRDAYGHFANYQAQSNA